MDKIIVAKYEMIIIVIIIVKRVQRGPSDFIRLLVLLSRGVYDVWEKQKYVKYLVGKH